MANPFEELGITQAELDAAMNSREVLDAKIDLANEAADYWRSISPEETGDYVDSIEVQVDDDNVRISATDESAPFIEFGTEDTPEFAPRAKTEAKFR